MRSISFTGSLTERVTALFAVMCLALGASGCGGGGPTELTVAPHRTFTKGYDKSVWTGPPPTSDQRYPKTADVKITNPLDLFRYELPEGWTAKPGTSRIVSAMFIPPQAKSPDATDMSATKLRATLSMAGGSPLENLNRWRKQLGLKDVDKSGLSKLPKVKFLSDDAFFVDLEGETFRGMGHAGEIKDARMLALMRPAQTGRMIFLKMVGTQSAMAPLKDDFLALAKSIDVKPHAGGPHGGGHGHPPTKRSDAPADGKPNAPMEPPYRWSAPASWKKLKPAAFSLATYAPTGKSMDAMCSISHFGNDVGGLKANIARWCRQVGVEPLDAKAIAALPTLPVLGRAAPYLTLKGTYKADGSGGEAKGAMMLVVYCDLGGPTLVVKLVGQEKHVQVHVDAFEELVTSIEENK